MSASLVFDLFGRDVSASKELRKVAAEADHSSSSISDSFKKAATGISIAAGGAAVESLHMAGDFQSQMTRLVTAAGESQKNLKMVSDGVLNIAQSTGTSTKQLADGMYMIESAGYHGAAGLSVLKAAAQGAAIEGADLGATGNALTTVMNDIHAPASRAADVMSQMVATVGEGKMTMNDLASSIHSVLPNAAALGISFPQVAGALAEMTSQGISAEQATQNLNHVIVRLASPTATMTKTMAMYGLTSSTVRDQLGQKGLTGTFEELSNAILTRMGPAGTTLLNSLNTSRVATDDLHLMLAKLPLDLQTAAKQFMAGKMGLKDFTGEVRSFGGPASAMGMQFLSLYKQSQGFNSVIAAGGPAAQSFTAAMKGMLSDQTGLQVALHLTGASADQFVQRVHGVRKATADASGNVRDWSVKSKTLNVQLARMSEVVQTAAIQIGTKLLPVVTALVAGIVRHKDVVMALVATLVALAVAVKTVQGAMAVAKAAQVAWTATTVVAGGVQDAYAIACQIANSETLAGIPGKIASTVATVANTVATGAASAAQWLFNAALEANPIGLVILAIAALAAGIYELVKHWQTVVAFLNGPWGTAISAAIAVFMPIIGIPMLFIGHWKQISEFVERMWHDVSGFFADMYHDITGFASRMWSDVTGFIARMWSDAVGYFNRGVSSVLALVGALPGRLLSALGNLTGLLVGAGEQLIQGLINGVENMVSSAWNAVKNAIGGLISGAKGLLGIHSPSTVFHDIGVNVGLGMSNGITESMSTIPDVVRDHMTNIVKAANGVDVPGAALAGQSAGGVSVGAAVQRAAGSAAAGVGVRGSSSMPSVAASGGTVVHVHVKGALSTDADIQRAVIGGLETAVARGVRLNIGKGIR